MSWKFPAQCIWQFSQQGCPTGGVTTEDKQIINFTEGHAQLVFLHCSITQFLTIYHTITVRSEIIMPQTFAIILFLKSFKILLLFPNPLLLFSHYSQAVIWKKILVSTTHTWRWQINYTICALIFARASVATFSHFHHVEQTGSLFAPHPSLPHGKAC